MTAVELSKLDQLKNALERVKESLAEASKKPGDLTIRDGALQRFEFTFELVWKTLKEFCDEKGNSANNPKDIFRISADHEFITDPLPWFEFLKNRNAASHLYDEHKMEQVFSDLPSFVT